MKVVLRPSMWVLRVPLALLLICGGILGFLPVLGFWMLPFGALLLAVDFTPIRPAVAGGVVRGRRKVSLWRRAWTAWRSGPAAETATDDSLAAPPSDAETPKRSEAKQPAPPLNDDKI